MPNPTYTIPAPRPGSRKSWRKTITGIAPEQARGYAVQGEFLDAGASYRITPGGIILGVDECPNGNVVNIWRCADDGTLAELKQITRKGPWSGKATINAIAKLVAANPWPTNAPKPILAASAKNTVAEKCDRCAHTINPGEGRIGRNQRGYRIAQHDVCPPRPNWYAGKCGRCGGWLDSGEGVLGILEGRTVATHPGMCPPPDQRKPVPPRPNERAESCARCWQTVPVNGGVYRDGAVYHHDGQCPTPAESTTWVVSYGRPGPRYPRPVTGYTIGEVLRATVVETQHPVPADTPGYRRETAHAVSAIWVVVAEDRPRYYRDEDGNNPPQLVGDDGWLFTARVRPATADEAADLLAEETVETNRTKLHARAVREIVNSGDGEVPAETGNLLALPGVRVEPRPVGSMAFAASYGAYIHLRVDRDTQTIWVLVYNGDDGDTWSRSNCGPYIARRLPATADRLALVDELAAEFGRI